MATYDESTRSLAPLETFDARAFVGGRDCPQKVCNLVLALAVFYDDFRDLMLGQMLVTEHTEDLDRQTSTRELGQRNGVTSHLFRLQAGMLHELLYLIRRNRRVVDTEPFPRIIRQIPKRTRAAWLSVLSVVDEKTDNSALARLVEFGRNHVSFHYDPTMIQKGYAAAFLGPDAERRPYISRGSTMAQTRFYFADAAAEKYMRTLGDVDTVEAFYSASTPVLTDLNHSLREIVVAFITLRGFAFRPEEETGVALR